MPARHSKRLSPSDAHARAGTDPTGRSSEVEAYTCDDGPDGVGGPRARGGTRARRVRRRWRRS